MYEVFLSQTMPVYCIGIDYRFLDQRFQTFEAANFLCDILNALN